MARNGRDLSRKRGATERRSVKRRAPKFTPTGQAFERWHHAAAHIAPGLDLFDYHVLPPHHWMQVACARLPDGSEQRHVLTLYQGKIYIGSPDPPYPLYKASNLTIPGTSYVVENERTAHMMSQMYLPATTSLSAPDSAALTDWSRTKGRDMVFLPNAHDAGLRFAEEAAPLCLAAGAKSARIVLLPGLKPGQGP